ncbi:MAG: hypothetical protein NTW65_02000 [Deltaproteobacteria bacterium]|nr:hypothetical protein [Deltaproteobacteria bacterium]
MDAITGYLSTHPAVLVTGVIFIVILILHFIFKNLVKLVLIMFFVLLAAFGYDYLKNPNKVAEIIKESVETVKSGINDVTDKRKSIYEDTKELYNKGKKVPGDINKLLKDSDKEADKEFKK